MSKTVSLLVAEQLKELDSKYSEDFRLQLVEKIKSELLWCRITARDASNRRVLHTNLEDCEKLSRQIRRLSDFVDNYESVLKGEIDSYSSTFLKKELKKKVSLLIDEEVDNLDNIEFSDAL